MLSEWLEDTGVQHWKSEPSDWMRGCKCHMSENPQKASLRVISQTTGKHLM